MTVKLVVFVLPYVANLPQRASQLIQHTTPSILRASFWVKKNPPKQPCNRENKMEKTLKEATEKGLISLKDRHTMDAM